MQRIPLVRREVREFLSERALEILLGGAELLIEGDRDLDRRFAEANRAYATVMATIQLERFADVLREPADAATAECAVELMRKSPAVRRQLSALARPELAKLLAAEPRSLHIELLPTIRREGTNILIDGDAVVSLRTRAARRAADGSGR